MRRVTYITGTRADFGLMCSTLKAIDASPQLSLDIIVTGMHLISSYGNTVDEVEQSGLRICARVKVSLSGSEGSEMALALGQQVIGITQALKSGRPDILLVLGDRGEMLAGAIAALHLNIPVVHVHGGELSGTVDESIRHAISKLAHYHFTSTTAARERLLKMGEQPATVFVTGAPGLDEIVNTELQEKKTIFFKYGLDEACDTILVLFHPVVQQAEDAAWQTQQLMQAIVESNVQALIILPNADAGGDAIRTTMCEYVNNNDRLIQALHISRVDFLSLVAAADAMVGNSSSGIIEAASLKTPVVNVGDRQNNRERNENIIDTNYQKDKIQLAINCALKKDCSQVDNRYGDGLAGERIVDNLSKISLDPKILEKLNAY